MLYVQNHRQFRIFWQFHTNWDNFCSLWFRSKFHRKSVSMDNGEIEKNFEIQTLNFSLKLLQNNCIPRHNWLWENGSKMVPVGMKLPIYFTSSFNREWIRERKFCEQWIDPVCMCVLISKIKKIVNFLSIVWWKCQFNQRINFELCLVFIHLYFVFYI